MDNDLSPSLLDAGLAEQLNSWYGSLTGLERVGVWSLVTAGATVALLAFMPSWLRGPIGGALVGSGAQILAPVLRGDGGDS